MTEDEISASVLRRQASARPRVSHSDPVTLHDSSKLQIVLVPMFVHRSAGDELAVKLVRYNKSNMLGSADLELPLQEAAARRLHRALAEHLAIAGAGEDGQYIALRIDDGRVDLGDLSPETVASAVAKLLREDEIVDQLASQDLGEEIVNAFRGAIRLRELRTALDVLRQHLDGGETAESTYQRWCEKHSWAFGNAHVVNDRIRAISTGDQVDLLVPRVLGGFRDLIELKRPDHTVIAWDGAHNNWYFAAEVSKAIGQCHRYLDVLHDGARTGLLDAPDVIAYHPRATIVIGRSNDWNDERHKALHGLNCRLSGISVMTYDHLLAQGERTLEVVSTKDEADDLAEIDLAAEPVDPWDGLLDDEDLS